MSTGLHHQIKTKAQNGRLQLSELKPNSREVAQRMIEQGQLIKTNGGYVWHETQKA